MARLVPPAEEAKAKYELVDAEGPRLTGTYLRILAFLAKTPLNPYIYSFFVKRSALPRVLDAVSYPEKPRIYVVPNSAEREKIATSPCTASSTNERLKQAISSLGEHGLSVQCCTSNMVRPTVRDYHWVYSNNHVLPSQVASRIIKFLDDNNAKYQHMVAYDPEDIRRQAAASEARFKAGKPLGVLDGVPYVVKDNFDAVPYPTTCGVAAPKRPVKEDSPTIAALRASGAILIGKASMQELGLMPFGIDASQGTALHPADPKRMCGGSSSGCAAMVACGAVPFAIANDGGGSIRIPAALCGVTGLKPTLGRTYDDNSFTGNYSSLTSTGIISITPIDTHIVYAAICPPAPAGPRIPPQALAPEGVVAAEAADGAGCGLVLPKQLCPWQYKERGVVGEVKPLAGLKLGVYKQWFNDADGPVKDQCGKMLAMLESIGATLVDVTLPELEEMAVAHQVTFAVEMVQENKSRMEKPTTAAELNPDSSVFLNMVKNMTPAQYAAAQRIRARAAKHFEALFKQVDVLLTPTVPMQAPLLPGGYGDAGVFDLSLCTKLIRFTTPANLLGLPALTIPVGRPNAGVSGLTAALQLVGRHWQEATLLAVAASLDEALGDALITRGLPALHTNPIWMERHPLGKEVAAQMAAIGFKV